MIIAADNRYRHIVIPVQSASDHLLSAMKRGYTARQGHSFIKEVAAAVPRAQIHSHLLVGFPGEEDEDVDRLIGFMRSLPMVNFKIYKYSNRPRTLASHLPGEISEAVIKRRFARVIDEKRSLQQPWNDE